MEQKQYAPLDLTALTTYSLADRQSKVSAADFAAPWTKGGGLAAFFDRLPTMLGAADLRAVIAAISASRKQNRPVMLAMGAHVIKVGLNPILIDLLEKRIITAIALNGAGIIHDFELAFAGQTSEDVAAALGDGSFGMARETGSFLSQAIRRAEQEQIGLGEAVGRSILEHKLPMAHLSLLATCVRLGIPITVHVAMGTDIIHIHPDFDPQAAGGASHRDFRLFAAVVADLEGGVYINAGSAVVLPEVFLKALSLARNLGHRVNCVTTVNLDFLRHYRPMTNVVNRPTASGGKGYHLTGHHELLIPLIAAGVIESLDC